MLSWFRKKHNEEPLLKRGESTIQSTGLDKAQLFEDWISDFKTHAGHLNEKLELLKGKLSQEDTIELINAVSSKLSGLLEFIDTSASPQDPDKVKYLVVEDVVEDAKNRLQSTSRSTVGLSSHPDADKEQPLGLTSDDELCDTKENSALSRKKILLVEDNKDLRVFYNLALSSTYEVLEAENGIEGLQMARQKNPDLIVSDLMMPEMDGIDLCKAIKNDINTNHIPFIILTAKDAVASRIEGTQSGADIYLSKPTSAELLQATIENIFLQREKIREYFSKKHYSEALTLVQSTKEQEFISRVITIIDTNLINPEFEVDLVCRELNLSRTKLYHKIKNLTGQSIIEFVRSYRLKKARELMTHNDLSLSEIIFKVGIQTPSYFTKAFKKEFGKTPSQFLEEIKNHK